MNFSPHGKTIFTNSPTRKSSRDSSGSVSNLSSSSIHMFKGLSYGSSDAALDPKIDTNRSKVDSNMFTPRSNVLKYVLITFGARYCKWSNGFVPTKPFKNWVHTAEMVNSRPTMTYAFCFLDSPLFSLHSFKCFNFFKFFNFFWSRIPFLVWPPVTIG